MDRFVRRLQNVLRDIILLDGEQDEAPSLQAMANEAKALLALPPFVKRERIAKVLPFPRAKELRAAKRASKRAHLAEIYRAVMERAAGVCESCRMRAQCADPLELDHFWGGSGRRTQRESVASTWALHRTCHRLKTMNRPDAAHWREEFARHCRRVGLPVPRECA